MEIIGVLIFIICGLLFIALLIIALYPKEGDNK